MVIKLLTVVYIKSLSLDKLLIYSSLAMYNSCKVFIDLTKIIIL